MSRTIRAPISRRRVAVVAKIDTGYKKQVSRDRWLLIIQQHREAAHSKHSTLDAVDVFVVLSDRPTVTDKSQLLRTNYTKQNSTKMPSPL